MLTLLLIVNAAFVRTQVGSEGRADVEKVKTEVEWSLKQWLNGKGEELGAGFIAMHDSIEQSARDLKQAVKEAADRNGNGTVTGADAPSFEEIKAGFVAKVDAAGAALAAAAEEVEAKIDADKDGSADLAGVKAAFHRAAEDARRSLAELAQGVHAALDRTGDGRHTAQDLERAGTEAADAVTALGERLGEGVEAMITTISTATWEEDSSGAADLAQAGAEGGALLESANPIANNFKFWPSKKWTKTKHCIVGEECWQASGFTFARLHHICNRAKERGATEVAEGQCYYHGFECKQPATFASYTVGFGMSYWDKPTSRQGEFFQCPEFDERRWRVLHGEAGEAGEAPDATTERDA